ncbi:MAG TPA: biotin--[acetyl-CoA-carboxylase] ligase, partial [Flavitalea sp.]|nr:biotin--[acetyl-CoA-carboxylase] ligase [Flavitalea sp.]
MFSQTFPNDRLSKPFILLSEVESTNNYAMAKLQSGLVKAGSCLMAMKQTKGKGQMGKNWESDPGSNITMSTVISLAGSEYHPFALSSSVALACVDLVVEAGIRGVQIKWPNDIYINDRKTGGVLIENLVRAGQPVWSVIGTGVNVNQTSFPLVSQAATSFLLEKKADYDPVELARRLHGHILRRTSLIATLNPAHLLEEYNGLLYRRGQ